MKNLNDTPQQPSTMDGELSHRILKLPQELQDIILFYTVPLESNQDITINDTYITPWQLQLNRTSRRQLARIYFSTNTFVALQQEINCFDEHVQVAKWLRAQSVNHRDVISKLDYQLLGTFVGSQRRRAGILRIFKEDLPVLSNAVVRLTLGSPVGVDGRRDLTLAEDELRDLMLRYPPSSLL